MTTSSSSSSFLIGPTTATATNEDDTNIIIPEDFVCPLTLELMDEPVMTRWGHSFERYAIMKWMEYHDHCPMTRNPISLQDVIVNRALKARIHAWKNVQCDPSSRTTSDDKDDLWRCSDPPENGDGDIPIVVDHYLPFLVSVDSTMAMIRALEVYQQKTNDPSARQALKQQLKLLYQKEAEERNLQGQHQLSKRRQRQQRAAIAA